MSNEVKNKLNFLRTSNNYSLSKLSKILKEKKGISVSASQLNYYEKGERSPRSDDVWKAIADFFGVTVTYLLGYEEYDKKLVNEDSDDFKKILLRASQNLSKVVGYDSTQYFKNYIDNSKDENDRKNRVNFVVSIGALEEKYAEALLRYSLLNDNTSRLVDVILLESTTDELTRIQEEAKREASRITKKLFSDGVAPTVWGDNPKDLKAKAEEIAEALNRPE